MKKGFSIISICIMSLFLCIQSGFASSGLRLSDGANTKTILDQSIDDVLALTGGVVYSGGIGNFIVTTSTGLTNPILGSPTNPKLNFTSLVMSVLSGGTLTAMFTQTDFEPGSYPVEISMGGTANGTTSYAAYIDLTNTAFGLGTEIANIGPFTNAYDYTTTALIAPSSKYSITTVATITHGSGTKISSFGSELSIVPEPISSALFIVGGIILGARSFYSRKK